MFNNYMIRVQVVRGGKKHFTTSQHFFQQTRSFCWTGTKFWCFFFVGFLTIFDSFILTRLQGLPTNRKGCTTFWLGPPHGSPQFFSLQKKRCFSCTSPIEQVAKNKKFQPNLAIFARPSWNFWFHFSHVIAPSLRDQWQSAPPELVQNAWRTKLGPWNFAALDGMGRVRVLSCWKVLGRSDLTPSQWGFMTFMT